MAAETKRYGGDGGFDRPDPSLSRASGSIQDQVAVIEELADDSDDGRVAGSDMIDRAHSGKPVLSGPSDLGLKDSDSRQRKANHEEPSQLGKPVQASNLSSDGKNL